MKILLGFAEAMTAAEAFFSLSDAGHEIRYFARKGHMPTAVKLLAPEGAVFVTAPETDAAAAQEDLVAAVTAGDFDAVFAIDDPSLWLVASVADRLGVTVINATGEQAAVALDKTRQVEAARAAGLAVPQTLVAQSPAEVRSFATLPAIAKPAMATHVVDGALSKGGARYFLDAGELAALPDTGHGLDFPALVQPLIHGTGVGVFGFACETGKVVNWSGHERVRMMNPHGSGSSACRSRNPAPDLCGRIEAMLKAIGWRGPFMVEFLEGEDGTLWFMELNGRLWGSLPLARRTGFEYPAWAAAQAQDASFVPPAVSPPARPVTMRHLGRDLLHLLFLLRGPKSAFHKERWPKLSASLPGVLKPHARRWFYNWDPRHPSFFWRDALADVKAKLGRG